MRRHLLMALAPLLATAAASDDGRGAPWARHAVDRSSRGADGVRLLDVNGDGRPDVATGWEEGGIVRAYLNPGPAAARRPWPAVTVGRVAGPEDAVFADLDGDGACDVVSACEGPTRGLFVHWAPRDRSRYLDPDAWETAAFPAALTGRDRAWMFAAPWQVDGRHGPDLFVGSKEQGGAVGWLEAPADPRDLHAWRWHPLAEAGWVMSLIPHDTDGDGDADLLVSDRRGPARGVSWFANPGPAAAASGRPWPRHDVGDDDVEVMFLTLADLDGDGLRDVVAAAHRDGLRVFRRRGPRADRPEDWEARAIPMPPNTGTAKAVAVGDIDLDGRPDLVVTCENAAGGKSGAFWLAGGIGGEWSAREISGPEGVKYDLVQLIDLDDDGDLDTLTCEERDNLGVIWYENPTR